MWNDTDVRHCGTCKTDVFAVYSTTQFEQHRSQGHCVALFPGGDVATMGMPDLDFVPEAFDPILNRPPSELDDLPAHIVKTLEGHQLIRIGDVVGLAEGEALELLQGSPNDLNTVKEVLAGRGLTLGMKIDGWTRQVQAESPPSI